MLIVTIAALVMAASLGWFAYRLMQEEQRRSEARVALLASALDTAPDGPAPWQPPMARRQAPGTPSPDAPRTVTSAPVAPSSAPLVGVPSVVMLDDDSRDMTRFASEVPGTRATAVPSAVPFNPTRVDERPAVTPTRDAMDVDDAPLYGERVNHTTASESEEDLSHTRHDGLFAVVPAARSGDGRGLIAVAALVLVACIAAGYAWFAASDAPVAASAATDATPDARRAPTAAAGGVPLDLLSLVHERRGEAIVVRGVVRNPVAGSARADLMASVILLDQAGGFLRSGRAALPTASLAPGAEVPFAVELPSTSDVRRYRVTFRGADGALVPHADKR